MPKFFKNCFLFKEAPGLYWTAKKRNLYFLYRVGMVAAVAFCMGLALLVLAIGSYPVTALPRYVIHWQTLLFNTLPVVLPVLFLYALIGRAWISFLIGGGVWFGLGLANYYKLIFRDDPMHFEDLMSIREATNMVSGDSYSLFVNWQILTAAFCLVLGTVLLCFLVRGKAFGWKWRASVSVGSAALAIVVGVLCMNKPIYNSLEKFRCLNDWSGTQNYVKHGFVYPFIHSISSYIDVPPEGYSKKEAEKLLAAYKDEDIPPERRVNVISIMREAYADFSAYDIDGFDTSCYEPYHKLEAEGYSGNLLTNIFSGGTIDTEQAFLTGNYRFKNFRSDANSYVWYMRNQGYTVEGSHPFYQWFYNRINLNGYLGFERYRFLEDDFRNLTEAYYPEDSVLYPEIYADYVRNKETGKPYFSFSVTVQSHGPYDTEKYTDGVEYLKGNYSSECKNAVNNYMAKIMDGNEALIKFADVLRKDPEPVVLVVFGDHMPWMGDDSVFYDEMGFDVDPGTPEGFRRRYNTRYMIWANDAAKEVLGNKIQGEGPEISPCYLMNLVFEQLGWEGPAFMQAMDGVMETLPVISAEERFVADGQIVDELLPEYENLYEKFLYMQHYWKNEFAFEAVAAKAR